VIIDYYWDESTQTWEPVWEYQCWEDPPPPDQQPIGWLDGANCSAIAGWALDQDTPSASIDVHVYDGNVIVGGYTTNVLRSDVNAAYGVDGYHGFEIPTPVNFQDGVTHYVYVYAINSNGVGPNPLLSGTPVALTCGAPPPPPPPPGCNYTVEPWGTIVGPESGAVSFEIATSVGCPWSASSGSDFLTLVSAGSGSGSATVTYAVASNSSYDSRETTLGIAGQSVIVAQRGATVTHRQIAIHWSPFFYQATKDNYDIPTNFDFDNDFNGLNNWENAYWYVNNFRVYVYYAYQEIDDSIYLTYMVFHPRDTKEFFGHENDMEGVRVRVWKNLSSFGSFASLETFAHWDFHMSLAPEWVGTHPVVYIESEGHGIYPSNNGLFGSIFPSSCGGLGIWYAGRGAETPENCDDRDVSMELISFKASLWPLRLQPGAGTFVETEGYVTGASFGRRFLGDDGCKANPPWRWDQNGGVWFLTPSPAGTSVPYVVNPYTDTTSSPPFPPCP
jgi:hypothetical protein